MDLKTWLITIQYIFTAHRIWALTDGAYELLHIAVLLAPPAGDACELQNRPSSSGGSAASVRNAVGPRRGI